MFKILSLTTLLLTLGCAVKDPGLYRAEHPVVVGFPGMFVHVNKSTAFGVQADEPKNTTLRINSGGKGESSYSINPNSNESENFRDLHSKGWGVDFFAMKFPWDQSSLFLGLDMAYRQDRIAFSEHSTQFRVNGSTENVEFVEQSYNFSALIGASKQWQGGLTLMGGFGPRIYRLDNREMIFDGGGKVDATARDATIASYDDAIDTLSWEFLAIIGKAF